MSTLCEQSLQEVLALLESAGIHHNRIYNIVGNGSDGYCIIFAGPKVNHPASLIAIPHVKIEIGCNFDRIADIPTFKVTYCSGVPGHENWSIPTFSVHRMLFEFGKAVGQAGLKL